MRLDKFLKVSRLIKRRTVANEACDAGRVLVNGNVAKASVKVKVGDIIEIQFGTKTVKVEVLAIQETTKKEEAKVGGDACFYEQMASNKYGLEEMPIPVKINAPQECTAIFLGEC